MIIFYQFQKLQSNKADSQVILLGDSIIIIISMIFRTQSSTSPILSCLTYSFSLEVKGFDVFPLEHYEEGQRLDRYLKATAIGWSSAQKHLRNGNIKVLSADGTIIKNNGYKFQPGDRLLLKQGLGLQQLLIGDKNINHIEMDFNLAKNKLDDMLIFDNQNLSIVNKPPGYSVQGGPDLERNLFSLMAARYRKEMVYISHRLDKPTTGIVLLPKNLKTARLLGKALQAREGIDKFYLALTEGSEIRQSKGRITCHIEWTNKHRAKISQEIIGNERSQQAQTMFIKLGQQKLSDILWRHCLALKLLTGRKHQIRCQLAQYFLNPIINDELYLGRKFADCDQAIFLHAFGLKINDESIIRDVFRLNNAEKNITNQSGTVIARNNQVFILAKQLPHWSNLSQLMSNQNLLNIMGAFGGEKVVRKKNTTLKIV